MTTLKKMTCDFYTQEQWNQAAVQMADMVQQHVFDRHFGVCPWFVERHFVFFGNEGRKHVAPLVETVRQEIELIDGMRELGVGVSTLEDGYSWAMIVNVEQMMADDSDDVCEQMEQAMQRAWKIARGFITDAPGRG